MQVWNRVFDAVLARMREEGKSDKEILQWASNTCHCDDCRAKRGQPPKERFAIPCNHPDEGKSSDYYPLTLDDVKYMAIKGFQAINEGNLWSVNDILCRLCQGIPGQTCPRELEGHTNEVELHLCEYYVRNVQFYGADPAFAEELYAIINS